MSCFRVNFKIDWESIQIYGLWGDKERLHTFPITSMGIIDITRLDL